MNRPLCFVIMPFGKKKDIDGNEMDFDTVYRSLIAPAIEQAGMEAIRADEETVNGIIHKPMYERLILCDYAVADLSTANANVFYEVGIRHAVKPHTTITIFSKNSKLPFDVNFLRCLPYNYEKDKLLTDADNDIALLKQQLLNAKKQKTTDSPVYQLVDGIAFQNSVAHEKTDIFREKVKYNEWIKKQLNDARNKPGSIEEKIKAVDDIASAIVAENEETGVLIDIMLSYRALGDYNKMIGYIQFMPTHVMHTVMVQEQLGFALNRSGRKEEAITVLENVLEKNGPSSETYGILGRVYKDLYEKATEEQNELLAEGYLDKSLDAYLKGFEADWRDAYPGVNAVTLLEVKGEKEKAQKLAPVVEYAIIRKLVKKKPEYWDYAALLELAVINNDESKTLEALKKAITCPIEGNWMPNTTIKNLQLINSSRKKRNENTQVAEKTINSLRMQLKS